MKNPKEDLVSILVNAKAEGVLGQHEQRDTAADKFLADEHTRSLNKDELIMFCVLLMVAGNETTRNGISGGMTLLMDNPEAHEKLVKNPALIPDAVEEMLRMTSPVVSFTRTATQDHPLGDKVVKKGQRVLMLYPSANRDEDEFPKADVFDIARKPLHVAFGIGNHFCLGANLARMEMRVAFREILRRIPDLKYADDGPVMAKASLVRSFQHLRVRYTPESRRAA
jgi:cytochrome P450